jgi:hypothetical protein
MGHRRRAIALAALLMAGAGCQGSNAGPPQDGGGLQDGEFSSCADVDAGPYMAGMTVASESRGLVLTVVSAHTTSSDAPPVDAPAVGLSTFDVTIADSSGGPASGLTMTANKPYMPFHKHSSSTAPVVTDQGGGSFVISKIDFFMHGYFEITLDLRIPPTVGDGGVDADAGADVDGSADDAGPAVATPTTDKVVLPICIPS